MTTLAWNLVSDTRMATACGRYLVDRQPSYERHPAVDFRYVAKLTDMQANPLGEFKNFKLAAEACEKHLHE